MLFLLFNEANQPYVYIYSSLSYKIPPLKVTLGFPGGTVGKESTHSAGDTRDMGSIPGLGRSPGVGNGNLLQYSCLENYMDKGAW